MQQEPPIDELRVYRKNGQELNLFPTGKSGGEGKICAIRGNHFECVKIFFRKSRTEELPRKIAAMIDNAPDDPTWSVIGYRSIGWPADTVFFDAEQKEFAGYTMPFIDTKIFKESHTYYDSSDRIRDYGGTFTWKYLTTAAFNIANAVTALHQKGHCIGDLRESNILVSPNTLIAIIDCDSFQIRDAATGTVYYTRVGTGEFLPPELHSVDFLKKDCDRLFSDRFALGVLIFKFLMLGVHPYQAKGPDMEASPSTESKILRGIFPYDGKGKAEPPDYAPPYAMIPPLLQELFSRCFNEGHADPEKRPAAHEWLEALRDRIDHFRECRKNRNHVYSDHLSECPWCVLNTDYFPQVFFPGHQVLLPLPGSRSSQNAPFLPFSYCPRCGVVIEFDYNNCPNCGMRVHDMA